MNAATEIGIIIGLIGCLVGIAGWLTNRDRHISDDAHWKGSVDKTLEDIKDGVSGIGERMAKVEGAIATLNTQNALHTSKIKELDNQIQELKQNRKEQEHTA